MVAATTSPMKSKLRYVGLVSPVNDTLWSKHEDDYIVAADGS